MNHFFLLTVSTLVIRLFSYLRTNSTNQGVKSIEKERRKESPGPYATVTPLAKAYLDIFIVDDSNFVSFQIGLMALA